MDAHVSRRRLGGRTGIVALAHGLVAVLVAASASIAAAPGASAQAPPGGPEVTVTVLEAPDNPAPFFGRTRAYDVNNRGQAVGETVGPEGHEPALWDGGRLTVLPRGEAAYRINDRGDVIVSDGYGVAYHWRDGRVTDINRTPDEEVGVIDLDESGQVLVGRGRVDVGFCSCAVWQSYEIWQDGVSTPLQLPPAPQGLSVRLVDLSDSGGYVLGEYGEAVPFVDSRIWNATGGIFLWHAGTTTRLTTGLSRADAVNRNGQVVGSVGWNIFDMGNPSNGRLWSGGRETRLNVRPYDINDRGQVVGTNDQSHAVLWENGRVTDLGTLPGGESSVPYAVNERGQVLGHSDGPDGCKTFLWTSGRLVDLGLGECSNAQYSLNDESQAVGTLYEGEGPKEVMWTVHDDGDPGPVDPPAQQCVTAPNRDHVQAGRATSWLIFTWATGSGTYIGLASQSTSLREAAPGSWEPVASC